jgi:hypothetical protein
MRPYAHLVGSIGSIHVHALVEKNLTIATSFAPAPQLRLSLL